MIRKLLLAVFILAAFATPGRAQQTNVTGTVLDPNGIPYAGATLKVSLTPTTSGQLFWTGGTQAQCVAAGAGSAPCKIPFTPPNAPIELDSTGSFQTSLYPNGQISPAGTQWQFQININSPGPLGPGAVTFTVPITIVGANQSVSVTLTAAAPQITATTGIGSGGTCTTCGTVSAATNIGDCAVYTASTTVGDAGGATGPCPTWEMSLGSFLQNPAFDVSSSLAPIPGWTLYDAPFPSFPPTLSYDTSTYHTPPNALVVTAQHQYTGITTTQRWAMAPGDTAWVSAWVKGGGDNAGIAITGWTSGGYTSGVVCEDHSSNTYFSTSTWTRITFPATNLSALCPYYKVQLEDGAASPSGNIEWDDVRIMEGDPEQAGIPTANYTPVTVQANSTSGQATQVVTLEPGIMGDNSDPGEHLHYYNTGTYTTQAGQTPTLRFQTSYGLAFFIFDVTTTALPAAATAFPWAITVDCLQTNAGTTGALECGGQLVIDLGASATAASTVFLFQPAAVVGNAFSYLPSATTITQYITFSTQPGATFNAVQSRLQIAQAAY
jgi:hypothetical protein